MCDSGRDEKKLRVFKVFRPTEGGKHWIARDFDHILDAEFDCWEPGDRITIETAEMTESQIEALPEFEGW